MMRFKTLDDLRESVLNIATPSQAGAPDTESGRRIYAMALETLIECKAQYNNLLDFEIGLLQKRVEVSNKPVETPIKPLTGLLSEEIVRFSGLERFLPHVNIPANPPPYADSSDSVPDPMTGWPF